jgi:hypothetical protein
MKHGFPQIGCPEVGAVKEGFPQIGCLEIGILEIRYCRPFTSPFIPRTYPFIKFIVMILFHGMSPFHFDKLPLLKTAYFRFSFSCSNLPNIRSRSGSPSRIIRPKVFISGGL